MTKTNKTNVRSNFLNYLLELNSKKATVKEKIGDSVHNQRTLSVNQVIRYLQTKRNGHDAKVLRFVEREYSKDTQQFLRANRTFNNRSDAYDIREFVRLMQEFT